MHFFFKSGKYTNIIHFQDVHFYFMLVLKAFIVFLNILNASNFKNASDENQMFLSTKHYRFRKKMLHIKLNSKMQNISCK